MSNYNEEEPTPIRTETDHAVVCAQCKRGIGVYRTGVLFAPGIVTLAGVGYFCDRLCMELYKAEHD